MTDMKSQISPQGILGKKNKQVELISIESIGLKDTDLKALNAGLIYFF